MTTHEEELNLLYNYAVDEWNLGTSARKLIDGAYAELEKAINEHEALKKDVARFMELSFFHKAPYSYRKHYANENKSVDESVKQAISRLDEEWFVISQKLSKVGNEE